MIGIPAYVAVAESAVLLATVPPGVCTVILANTGSNPVTVGLSSSVTASTGFPLPAGATVTVPGFPGSTGVSLYAIAGTGTNNVGVIISTAR